MTVIRHKQRQIPRQSFFVTRIFTVHRLDVRSVGLLFVTTMVSQTLLHNELNGQFATAAVEN